MNTTLKILLLTGAVLSATAVAGAATAQEHWTKDCQKCHAADGSASGPMGKKLKLKNYTDPAVQTAMSDEEIVQAIKAGTKDEKTGKQTMPGFVDKYTEEDISAMKDLIRSMAKTP